MIFSFFLFISKINSSEIKSFIKAGDRKWYIRDFEIHSEETIITERLISTTNISLFNCKFYCIESTERGGAIYINLENIFNSENQIFNCQFINCISHDKGGCLFINSNQFNSMTNIKNSTFTNNSCDGESGGAIYSSNTNLTITNCLFTENHININTLYNYVSGGTLYLSSGQEKMAYIENSSFINNSFHQCSADVKIEGGVIHSFQNVYFNYCTFSDNYFNTTKIQGGVVYGYVHCSNSIFYNNSVHFTTNMTININIMGSVFFIYRHTYNCTYDSNFINLSYLSTASPRPISSGMFYTSDSIENCRFTNNYLFFDITSNEIYSFDLMEGPMGIFFNSSECDFINNSLYLNALAQEFEGLLFPQRYASNCNFLNNSCSFNSAPEKILGSIVYSAESLFTNCTFSYNTVFINEDYCLGSWEGGCFYQPTTINNCSYLNNFISINCENCNLPGGIAYVGSVTNTNIFSNTLKTSCNDTKTSLFYIVNAIDCLFENNIIQSLVPNEKQITLFEMQKEIENCIFSYNSITNGSEIYLTGNVVIRNCTFICKDGDKMSSMFFFDYPYFPKEITNSKFLFLTASDIVIFDGSKEFYSFSYCTFSNNCIFPYEEKYFKKSGLILYDSSKSQTLTFNDIFESACPKPATNIFTASNIFTNSNMFETNIFTGSNIFTASRIFTESNVFTNSNTFDSTAFFTTIPQQTPISQRETKSFYLSLTEVYIKSVSFSASYISEYQSYTHMYYVIYFLSPSYVPTYLSIIINEKKGISREQLIGVVCGTTAVFFGVLGIIIMVINRERQKKKKLYDEISFSSEESEDIEKETYIQSIEHTIDRSKTDEWI